MISAALLAMLLASVVVVDCAPPSNRFGSDEHMDENRVKRSGISDYRISELVKSLAMYEAAAAAEAQRNLWRADEERILDPSLM